MLLTENVEMKWNSKNKQYYINKGYIYTKMNDSFMIDTNDLKDGSNIYVNVKCDYCGKEYKVMWYHRINSLKNISKDCCNDKICTGEKSQDVIKKRYNVNSVSQLQEVKDKVKETNISKYGVSCVFKSDEIKEKIKQSNLEKYGYEFAVQSDEVKNKTTETCLRKYGVKCFLNLDYIGDKIRGENSPTWKGGVKFHRHERATFKYISWRKLIFSRDNYTCQCCGANHTEVQAHHIFNWKDNEDKRYDIDNGITLCKECHMKFHSVFGKHNNSIDQLKQFLNHDKEVC